LPRLEIYRDYQHPFTRGTVSVKSLPVTTSRKMQGSSRRGQVKRLSSERCYCPGNFPGCLALLMGAEPIECVPGCWLEEPVPDEQAPTNRPVSSNANAASAILYPFSLIAFFLAQN